MTQKRTSLDSLNLEAKTTIAPQTKRRVQPSKTSKIQKACYFEPATVATIEAYILHQKQTGNRGESFNKCVNEGLKLLITEKGLK